MAFSTTDLQKTLIEAINRINIIENTVLHWHNRDVKILNCFLEEGVVTKERVSELLHTRLKEIGRACYAEHLRGMYPDHTVSPSAFAYALLHDEFTPKEELRIKFDHGETKEEFITLYEKNLIESVFCQLTKETESLAEK